VGYACWMALLVVAYYVLPGIRVVSWGLIGLSGVTAIIVGIAVNHPRRKTPWLLLAAANVSFAVGQVSFLAFTSVLRDAIPFPSFIDVFYLLTYPLYAGALAIFIRWRSPYGDRRSVLDALILTTGLALVLWIYLILPDASSHTLTLPQKVVAIAYPLGDVLVLALLARLLAPGTDSNWPVRLLSLGALGLLASDVPFGLTQLHGTFHSGTVTDLGWAFFYGAWGAAALFPDMAELTRPVPPQQPEASRVRLVVLLAASLVAPTVLLIESFNGHAAYASIIAVFSAILYVLVLTRLRDVVALHRRALGRERAVRLAGASLASAITVEEVADSVTGTADRLVGKGPWHLSLLAVRSNGGLRPVRSARGDVVDTDLASSWLPLLTEPGPVLLPASELCEQAEERTARPAAASDRVLLCPLVLGDRPSGDPLIGVLAVAGEERVLTDLLPTLEILAQEAALAIERVRLTEEVARQGSEAYFRTLVQDASDVILIVDDDERVKYATPSAAGIFGRPRVAGTRLQDLVGVRERDPVRRATARARERRDHDVHENWQITRPDGTSVRVQVSFSDLRGDPTVDGLVLTLRDVTEQRKLEDELKYQAYHDSLTGLPNRVLFGDRATRALARARRDGTMTAVLFVDLDDFKMVNDTMGHKIGDELLVAVGARLKAVLRSSDAAARFGGDEFALLLEDLTDATAADRLAERVVNAFSEPFALSTGMVMATVTVGVAVAHGPDSAAADADELLSYADLALYAAKAGGKRRWRRYQPELGADLIRRRELQTALEDAVNRSAFTLAYQPIAVLGTGEVAGFEALLRWPTSPFGEIEPTEFIPLAEESGLIVPLGRWVLERATADLARWQAQASRQLHVGVNVSARQFRDPGFVQHVRQTLDGSGLDPSSLLLELTESVLLDWDEWARADWDRLRDFGLELGIDDFGTGYSSLSYLRELPIDVLKIDKSFIDGIASSQQRLAIVQGIVRMARTLELEVIGEGIESEQQRDLLLDAGCRLGQGHLLATPMPAAAAEKLIQSGHLLSGPPLVGPGPPPERASGPTPEPASGGLPGPLRSPEACFVQPTDRFAYPMRGALTART
jgi:diguanylate cyclase (GGDEF)-like protein/PAS domain S-box-containing protein